ncbi:MAG TPA: hypothetical protein VES19_04705 [Candidatus Limnocylindrales bacterium]|nr:hypothetical protein [Candidatus Limnocylindrales bacterium]
MPVSNPAASTCLQCGLVATRAAARMCRRCGIPFGEAPPESARLAECPVCYRESDADGRFASRDNGARRLDINEHVAEHDRYPVGDDAYLETLRIHDRIRIGHWSAPYDLVRRYLVTGVVDAGRNRLALHNSIVTAMTQVQRWGPGAQVMGDQAEWKAARDEVEALMERYHRRSGLGLAV